MIDCIVAFPKESEARTIRSILVKNGFSVSAVVSSGAAAIGRAEESGGGIIVCAYQFRDMIYSGIRNSVDERWTILLICNPSRLAAEPGEGVVLLPMPFKVSDLVGTVTMIEQELGRRKKRRRAAPSQRNEEEKRDIERAKMLLMDRNNMTEEAAHRYLQKSSMEYGRSLTETARMILSLGRS